MYDRPTLWSREWVIIWHIIVHVLAGTSYFTGEKPIKSSEYPGWAIFDSSWPADSNSAWFPIFWRPGSTCSTALYDSRECYKPHSDREMEMNKK